MSNKKKTDNKQNIKKNTKLSNKQKKNFEIIGFICSILLLVFLLLIIFFNTKVKSSDKSIMKQFNEAYKSTDNKVIFYHNSDEEDSNYTLNYLEQVYMNDFKKEFNIDYVDIDISKLSEKNNKSIVSKLGISGITPSVIIVNNRRVIGVSDGYIESHNLLKLFKDIKLVDNDVKYSKISNLKYIDYDDYKKIIKEKDINVIIVGKAGCKYCMSVKPKLNNISKAYKKKFNYLDLSDLESEDVKKFFEDIQKKGYDDEQLKEEQVFSTPTVLVTKDNKIKAYVSGSRELEEYIEFLKKNKAIE